MDGITCDFLGPVDDLAPVFDRAKLFVVPTRFSAGVPIKVFTSAGFGVPCVVTPLIAEQTGWEENRDFLVGSDPRSFALACASLLRDRELWEKIRAGALARFAEDCSRGHFRDAIRQVLSDILSLPDELANTTPVIIPGRGDYRTWITLFDTLSYLDRLVIAERIGKMSRPPTISVVVPAYNTPEHILRRCIESVQRQLYPYWELCIVDDASSQPHVARLCEAYARCDQRIHFRRRETNGHIAAATNSALEFASGEFVAFLDHDDLLAPHALYVVAEELRRDPEVDLIFTDEDKVDETGVRLRSLVQAGLELRPHAFPERGRASGRLPPQHHQ